MRQRLADAHIGLEIMRLNTLRTLSGTENGTLGREAMIGKLYWATWHRGLGELAMDVLGAAATVCGEIGDGPGGGYDARPRSLQRLFLFSRSDTIYAGSNEIQRNIIGERALGLPKEPATVTSSTSPAVRPPDVPAATTCSPARSSLVTAAAGTGIGSATARRAAGRGGRHRRGQRRPRAPPGRDRRRRLRRADGSGSAEPLAVACDVTDEDQVQALFAAAVERPRAARRRGEQRRASAARPTSST